MYNSPLDEKLVKLNEWRISEEIRLNTLIANSKTYPKDLFEIKSNMYTTYEASRRAIMRGRG